MTSPVPGSFAVPATAPVYADGIPVSLAVPPASAQSRSSQSFWSTQPRRAGDTTADELTVSLGQPRTLNYIALDLPHFPHAAFFWWHDGTRWQPLATPSGVQLVILTAGSVPAVVDNPAAMGAGLNPYHYGAGHWVRYSETVTRVTTSKLLVHLVRPSVTAGQQVPVSPAGQPSPYPLGIRNLDFGLRILAASDVPPALRSPVTLTARQPFTTTTDVAGSPVQVAVRENRACDLLQGATWRCAPQPSSSSVVSLYLDSRDSGGSPQLVSSFDVTPVTSGIRFNLYWSAGPPPAGVPFTALDDPLAPGLISPGGTQPPVTSSQGIIFGSQPGWLDLANQAATAGADSPWWAALEIMPGFSSSDPGSYVVADAGIFRLSFSGGAWLVTAPSLTGGPAVTVPAASGDSAAPGLIRPGTSAPGSAGTYEAGSQEPSGALADWSFGFSSGDRLQFAVGFDGTRLFAWCPQGSLSQVPAAGLPQAPLFRLGAAQDAPGATVLPGKFTLTSLILKQEQADLSSGVPADLSSFARDPSAYVTSGQLNAAVRFDPSFILGTVCPWGLVGGLGQAYEACSWVMIPRSYVLAKGYVEFDPVLASAWKFEFTALQPETYEYSVPVTQTASFFPPQARPPAAVASPTSPAVIDPGLAVTQAMAPALSFGDAPPPKAAPAAAGTVLATEALYAPDPPAASRLSAAGGALYSFQPWQPPHAIPASASGPSSYQQAAVQANTRVAYFAAISALSMYVTDYSAADDTAQYNDAFATAVNVDPGSLVPGGWSFLPGTGLVTPSDLSPGGASAESIIFSSSHSVTGLQFATVQSPPVQLLPDPDFSDPDLSTWGPAGDALPLVLSGASAQLGLMIAVQRSGSPDLNAAQPSAWAYLEDSYPSWTALSSGVPAWADFGQPLASSSIGGIAYTGPPVPTSPAGRVTAAARVFSPVALSAPLYLQILDAVTGTVIAEAAQPVAGGTVTEWTAGFTAGQVSLSETSWSQTEENYPAWSSAEASGTWSQADTTTAPLGASVTVQVVQLVSTGDTWDIDNLSVYDDAISWQFSNDGGSTWHDAYDVRNNARGAILFPAAAQGQGTQLKWRVSGHQPGLTVSSLSVRPWYVTWPRGVPPRPAGIGHGPNLAPGDHYAAVENDPRWQLSSGPVPDDWYFAVRQALGAAAAPDDFPGPAAAPAGAYLRRAVTWEPRTQAFPVPTWTDLYSDAYGDSYAPADGGDVYTDAFGDEYGVPVPVITGTARAASAVLAASASVSASAAVIPLPAFAVGADLGPVPASDPSVAAWITATGTALPARRIALGNQFPATLAASPAAGDAGVRRVLIDIRPDSTTAPGQLDAFLASCAQGNLEASVSVWAGADAAFPDLQDWLDLLDLYVPVIRRNGFAHVVTVADPGWLDSWYPGDDLVDGISPVFWCAGAAPGSGSPTLAAAQSFADRHGKPFGLAGFGADHAAFSSAQGEAFIAYVTGLFAARREMARPCGDLFWLGTGTYSIVTAPAGMLAAYQAMAAAL